jgi:hypothetical protein
MIARLALDDESCPAQVQCLAQSFSIGLTWRSKTCPAAFLLLQAYSGAHSTHLSCPVTSMILDGEKQCPLWVQAV